MKALGRNPLCGFPQGICSNIVNLKKYRDCYGDSGWDITTLWTQARNTVT